MLDLFLVCYWYSDIQYNIIVRRALKNQPQLKDQGSLMVMIVKEKYQTKRMQNL